MNISRELAIRILKYLDQRPDFYFPFTVVCQEYTEEDDDFVEIESNEWDMVQEDEKYQTFQLWENLKNPDEQTLHLMSKGFIEKITRDSFRADMLRLIKSYQKSAKVDVWLSNKSEDFGDSEFFLGKAEGYEECLGLLNECA